MTNTTDASADWTIQPLCFAEFTAAERSTFTYFRDPGTKHRAPAIGFLLRNGDRSILVDTGPGDPASNTGLHTNWVRSPDQRPAAAVAAAGVDPETIETVILTHLHYDHAYNLEDFPAARFIVQAEELRAAVDPVLPQRTVYEFGQEGLIPPWMTLTHRLSVVRGDREIFPGVRVIALPGHTPGMQGVIVDTVAGPHVLAGDLVSTYENWGAGCPDDWIMPGIHTDVYACERSYERIADIGGVVIPSHDWAVFDTPIYPAR